MNSKHIFVIWNEVVKVDEISSSFLIYVFFILQLSLEYVFIHNLSKSFL